MVTESFIKLEQLHLDNDLRNKLSETLSVSGEPFTDSFSVNHVIPESSYNSQPVSITFMTRPVRDGRGMKGYFYTQSTGYLSEFTSRESTIDETYYMEQLLEAKFPAFIEELREVTLEHIDSQTKKIDSNLDKAQTRFEEAKEALDIAKRRQEVTVAKATQVKVLLSS